jgi:hypothetical protein
MSTVRGPQRLQDRRRVSYLCLVLGPYEYLKRQHIWDLCDMHRCSVQNSIHHVLMRETDSSPLPLVVR